MREDQIGQAERRETLDNDLKVGTFHQHAQAQADEVSQGRFAATGTPRVIGAIPATAAQYPAASTAHQTELPPEKPLGYSIEAMPELEPSTPPVSVEATDDPADAPSSGSGSATPSSGSASEPAGSSPLTEGLMTQREPSAAAALFPSEIRRARCCRAAT